MLSRTEKDQEIDRLLKENKKLKKHASDAIKLAEFNLNKRIELRSNEKKLLREVQFLKKELNQTQSHWWKYLLVGILFSGASFILLLGLGCVLGIPFLGITISYAAGWSSLGIGSTPFLFTSYKMLRRSARAKKEREIDNNASSDFTFSPSESKLEEIQLTEIPSNINRPYSPPPLVSKIGYFKTLPLPFEELDKKENAVEDNNKNILFGQHAGSP